MSRHDDFIFWDEMWNVSGDTKADQTNNNVSLLPDEQWDYYSGLPNPTYYENNNEDEKNITEDSVEDQPMES
jgi:hypothetical protein